MDFTLTHEQRAVRELTAEFVDRESAQRRRVGPRRTGRPSVLERLGELGILGMTIPEEYGGSGGDHLSYCLVMEELGRGDSSVRGIVSVSLGLVAKTIPRTGRKSRRQDWLPGLCPGSSSAASASPNPTRVRRRLAVDPGRPRRGRLRAHGPKCSSPTAPGPNVAIVFARTGGPGAQRHHRLPGARPTPRAEARTSTANSACAASPPPSSSSTGSGARTPPR